jgi:hypothetical protein
VPLPGIFGVALVAATSFAGGALGGHESVRFAEAALRAALEALLLGAPVVIVGAVLAGLRTTPASMAAALSLSLAVAGVVTVLVLPFVVFLAVCAAQVQGNGMLRGGLLPVVGFMTAVVVLARIARATHPGARASLVTNGWAMLVLAAFVGSLARSPAWWPS